MKIIFINFLFAKKWVTVLIALAIIIIIYNCSNKPTTTFNTPNTTLLQQPDTTTIPKDEFGDMVRYGRNILLQTAYYIGPNGIAGHYTKNKMNCSNCHQEAGTKPYSLNLMLSHTKYPQYRPREGKVLTLANRVNNCVMRPHSGDPLPLDSKEMTAILSYLKWINNEGLKNATADGYENVELPLLDRAASSTNGKIVYEKNCQRCHQENGEGQMLPNNITYLYPPLWGQYAYQPGSSMHRVTKQARWLKSNMPHDMAYWYKPILTDAECYDVAAFVNNDSLHKRPNPPTFDYPNINDKNMDYGKGPYRDTFSEYQHKYGPWPPIIAYYKTKGWKLVK